MTGLAFTEIIFSEAALAWEIFELEQFYDANAAYISIQFALLAISHMFFDCLFLSR